MKAFYCIPFFLYACGSDTPSFVEIPEGIITLSVNETSSDSDEIDDAGVYSGSESESAFSGDVMASNTPDGDDAETPAGSVSNTPDSGEDSSNSQAVVKACAPHFKGLAQKIRVIDGDSGQLSLKISPDTAIAFKITGNQTKLTINLPAGNDLPGVCFFVTGNQAKVNFTSASLVSGFTYIGRGNKSEGTIAFLGGSPIQAHIELKGNGPTLKVQGLDSDLYP